MQVCTYAGNKQQILRCDVCDSVRGTHWDYYLGQNAEISSGSQQAAAKEASGKSASPAAVPDPNPRLSRGQKSILGFFSDVDHGRKPLVAASLDQPSAAEPQPDRDPAAASLTSPSIMGTCHRHSIVLDVCTSYFWYLGHEQAPDFVPL